MHESLRCRLQRLAELRDAPFRKPLEQSAIEAFEKDHGIVLPEGLRSVLMHVGDGVAESHRAKTRSLLQMAAEIVAKGLHPSAPFELLTWWNWSEDLFEVEDIDNRITRVHQNGVLLVASEPYVDWYLVVRGSRRGEIWASQDTCFQPLAPSVDFLTWIEYRLDGQDDWWRDFDYIAQSG